MLWPVIDFILKVFNGNGTCSLDTEPSNFTNPVVARYIRVIPIQWAGASVCLRMELYGCTVKGEAKNFKYVAAYMGTHFTVECQSAQLPDRALVSLFPASSGRLFNISDYLCALDSGSQAVTLWFNESLYITQLQARSNSITISIFTNEGGTLAYQNTIGLDVSLLI